MRIPKSTLLGAIEFPSSIVKSKLTIPAYSHLLLKASEKRLSITACDSDQNSVSEVDCEGDLEPCCVSCSSLNNIAMLFGEKVEMSLKSGKLEVESGGSFSLNILPSEQFPSWNKEGLRAVGVE